MQEPQSLSFAIISLGCSKNLVDSERVNGDMIAAGFVPAESTESADIVIINTCGFITPAKEESIGMILDAAGAEGERRVAVMGCLSQRYGDELTREMPEIDFIYGIPDGAFVRRLCDALGVAPPKRFRGRRTPLVAGLSYSFLKISEGCSNRCSYCAIPLIRGGRRPFPPGEILREARDALAGGAVELDLVAQDTASYRYGETRLPELVASLSRLRGLRWLRLLYCHPDHLSGPIIRSIAGNRRVVKYIDIPFQHASGRILRSMGRRGDAERHLALIARLRRDVPGIRIRSTFMVGYPGESDRDFAELMAFMREARIDRAGAFIYSPEEGTAAAGMGGQVPEGVKRARFRRLMTLQRRISERSLESMIGSTVRVLVEERLDAKTFIGRSEYDAPEVDGIFYLTARDAAIKSIVRARVTGAAEYDLYGEPA
ncbi:MAG: 30S ribosomal protein S12 methylthiotransferase RimO [Spirochaetes bacterium]|nr:30S ribosomal protein S12 methylthiotransferase RimO [Spirochaetota bacterium]